MNISSSNGDSRLTLGAGRIDEMRLAVLPNAVGMRHAIALRCGERAAAQPRAAFIVSVNSPARQRRSPAAAAC